MREAIDARVGPTWFTDTEHKVVWEWMVDFWRDYGESPTAKAVKNEFPHYKLIRNEEPVDYWLDLFSSAHRYRMLQEMLLVGIDLLQDERDIQGAANHVSEALVEIAMETSRTKDIEVMSSYEERLELYRQFAETSVDGLRGIPVGFASIDRALGGVEAEQLITMIGLPKGGKSTMLLHAARTAHEFGETPLFIGFEMSNTEQTTRLDAMFAGINSHRLRTGQLTEEEMDLLADSLRKRSDSHPFYMSADISSVLTVSGVRAKISEYQPGIVFIDGVYLMDDERGQEKNSAQALTNITRDLKRLAQVCAVPIVITTQVLEWKYSRKKGLTSGSIGYSSSFVQDSDAIIGVEATKDEAEKLISITEARNAPQAKVLVRWDWETMTFKEYAVTEDGQGVGGEVEFSGYDYMSDLDESPSKEQESPRRRRRRRAS